LTAVAAALIGLARPFCSYRSCLRIEMTALFNLFPEAVVTASANGKDAVLR